MTIRFSFDNSYAALPDGFFARRPPTPVAAPRLVKLNVALAETLGLDPAALDTPEGAAIFAGAGLPGDADPIALAYAGHQFGHFVPQLGDGRALLLGEIVGRDGARRDVQLKGAGLTPFSRGGDGRAALGPVLREYLVSEAMAALSVPTTRALAAATTGETVQREVALPGAVLTRVAASHIRVGTFQFFAARGDVDAVRRLADYAIARHDPEIAGSDRPYADFLDRVMARQAELVARWLLLGFVHGVMNTDNMAISGETIDYGPCAFLDAYDPATVFSSIDRGGRYAYQNQPAIAQWNLARLAECLLPLIDADADAAVAVANAALGRMMDRLNGAYRKGLAAKIGLAEQREGDGDLAHDFLDLMASARADFTLSFRRLGDAAAGDEAPLRALLPDAAALDPWLARWRARLAGDGAAAKRRMDRVNPLVIPRNAHVEAMIAAAVEHDDFGPFETLLAATARPFDEQPGYAAFAEAPPPGREVYRTFCGT